MLGIGDIRVLFQKMSMYWNRGDLHYLMELCPGFCGCNRISSSPWSKSREVAG